MFNDYIRALKLIWQADPRNAAGQLVAQIFMAIFPVAILFSLKSLFDAISTDNPVLDVILYWLGALAALTLLQSGATQWLAYLSATHQQRLTDFVAGQILDKSIHIPYTYFEDHNYHDSLHLAQRQSIFRLPQVFQQFQLFLTNILSLILLVGYFFSLITSYAWIILLVAIPVAVIKWYSGFALHRLEKKLVPAEREATYYHTIMTGEEYAKEIRTLNFGSAFLARFSQLREMIYTRKRGLQRRLLVLTMVAELAEVAVFFVILYGVINQAFLGLVTIGLLVVYIQGLQKIQSNLKAFLNAVVQLVQQRIFLRDIFIFLDIQYDTLDKSGHHFPSDKIDIHIKDVCYSYPGSRKPALQSINMHLKKGQMIGLVGANGSGKSTLVKLLAGLYHPDTGHITVGDLDLQEINADSFRNATSFLLQDFEKYFLSIEDIVGMGVGREKEYQRLIQALLKADALEFVEALPQGHKTKLGRIFKDGTQLSGGQWQKLSIARAFYRNPSIVVLDEPTSALDAIAEHNIFKHFKSEAADKITLVISHRIYNLKDTNYIYVLDEGRIVQEGTYTELVDKPGVFRSLYEQQAT
jgi:ATP-binding cassette subfamily B protein